MSLKLGTLLIDITCSTPYREEIANFKQFHGTKLHHRLPLSPFLIGKEREREYAYIYIHAVVKLTKCCFCMSISERERENVLPWATDAVGLSRDGVRHYSN